jgi:glycyl-tRNA synthetase beta chain
MLPGMAFPKSGKGGMTMHEFLFEIFSEEIPARMQLRAAEDLKKLVADELTARGLTFSVLNAFVTPRRLVAVVDGLPEATPSTVEERRGPKIGAPEGAIQGFLRSAGLSLAACEQRDGYYYARIETKPLQTLNVLSEIVQAVFAKMVWPKSMKWALEEGKSSQPWVRPVRSVLTVFKGQPLCFELPTLGLTTSNRTQGHRFLAPHAFEVSSFADYAAKLEKAFVILDHSVRQTHIWEGLEALAHQKGLTIQPDEGLLEEVAGLVEYPSPLLGQIEAPFMKLPHEVLSTAMRVHQKYFTVMDRQGQIAPYFGVVANHQGARGSNQMLGGYERVLRARLSDAAFFYDHDLNIPLGDLTEKLNGIVFHAKLGTLGQKVARLAAMMTTEAGKRAATLAKADLLTTMVGEFPELQGVMGALYATAQGEAADVAAAIRDHYQPQGPNDLCPPAPLSIELALADKIDALVGFFGVGEEPTGSKDPFALRRAALGVIRLIRENNLSGLSLKALCGQACQAYAEQGLAFKNDFSIDAVLDFMNERLKVALRGEGIRHDCVSSVLGDSADADNIWVTALRAKALQAFLETPDGQALLAAFRRAHGILTEEQRKDSALYAGEKVAQKHFCEAQEANLYDRLHSIMAERDKHLTAHDYAGLMSELATLRPAVDAFFQIKVNHEDPVIRLNRLELLGLLVSQAALIADFSKIETK